jgi:hypothetical protein
MKKQLKELLTEANLFFGEGGLEGVLQHFKDSFKKAV